MRIAILIAVLFCGASAEAQLQERSAGEPLTDAQGGLVDEDEDLLPQTNYAFNPIQAKKDLKVGKFYDKRGNQRAAAARYLEATKWNPQYAEAYWRLAMARDKLGQNPQALDAYRSYLALEANGKWAREARSRAQSLEDALENPPLAAGDPAPAEQE